MEERIYFCIDLKSFYASVECVERGLDPMQANLAVADPERGSGTLCLAISPSMKAMGVKNRCRVYQIPKHINYIMAPPRMKLYIDYSADVYAVYLKYFAKEDIHVYSIDEAFLDATEYLSLYGLTARELAGRVMDEVKKATGLTAAAGIGTNLYLAKVALDITAKHVQGNIGYLDENLYQEIFWGWGGGIEKRLGHVGILTMGDLAQADEDMLYRMFGIDAELLIDHAWGRESTSMEDIKSYQPKSNSLSTSQVLLRDYTFGEGRLLVKEMVDSLCLDLASQGLAARSLTVTVGYSHEAGQEPSSGSVSMPTAVNSYSMAAPYALGVYERIAQRDKPIRKLSVSCNGVAHEVYGQYHLFTDDAALERERRLQQAVLEIKRRYGRNALVRGMDLLEAGTTLERNRQIGGHKSGE